MKALLVTGTILAAFAGMHAAHADVVLTFGQSADAQAITATANGAGTATTITATDALVTLTQIDAAVSVPTAAFFDLNLASTGTALPLAGGGVQHYAGSFSITSGAGDTGTNFLSGSFADIVFGNGTSGVLAAGGTDVINFSSDVISPLDAPKAVALSFANLVPAFVIDNETLGSFTSSVSGTFSANAAVPEPASMALLGVGLLGLGMVRYSRR